MLFEYPQMVKALAKPGEAFIEGLTPLSAHLLHMAIGVSGEVGELLGPAMHAYYTGNALDRQNVIEELGDIEFYLEGYRQGLEMERNHTLGYPPKDRLPCSSPFDYAVACAVAAAELLDQTKKSAIYCKALDRDAVCASLVALELYLSGFRRTTTIGRQETLDSNMAKLAKRYSSLVYSNDAAQKRADKKEGE